jgi:putative FmdB family regulatory protein
MPLYEYECTACHKHTEKIQKFSDAEITICPHCGGKLERVISAPAIAFKGGGWYADGYGNAKPKSSGDSSSSSSDSAPAAKASSDSAPSSTPAAAAPAPAAAASSDKK